MAPYFLKLNEAAIIVLEGVDNIPRKQSPRFVQVIIKSPIRPPSVDVLAAFFYAEREITTVIESLVLAHVTLTAPKEILLEGKGYILQGVREAWPYGKKLKLRYGEQDLVPSEEKWIFTFEADGD